MSCIATFYLFEKDQRQAILDAKANEKREVVKKSFLFFTHTETIGEKHLSEWLEENCIKHEDMEGSGFFILDNTTEIYSTDEISDALFGDSVDEYAFLIDHDRATSGLELLKAELITDEKILPVAKEKYDDLSDEELKPYVDTYRYAHQWLIKWLESVSEGGLGLLYMSY